ncbi:MAG: DUF7933 domain-containing protein, partial [Verrucomicrobiales bacterium]
MSDVLPIEDICGTGSVLSGTPGNLSLSGGILTPGESCTFSVGVTVPSGTLPGTYTTSPSTAVAVISGISTTSPAASADLLVPSLTLTKEFIDDPVNPGQPVTLEFELTNHHPTEEASGISFTDSLQATLSGLVSTSGTQSNVCGTGSQIAGTSSLVFSGGVLAGGQTCTFTVNLLTPHSADPTYTYLSATSEVSLTMSGSTMILPRASDTLNLAVPEDQVTKTHPNVTINKAVGQLDPTGIQPIRFNAVFSEPVMGFVDSDVFVTFLGIGVPNIEVTEITPNDGTTYLITVSQLPLDGPVTASIPAGAAQS